jgi:hypothetical protein
VRQVAVASDFCTGNAEPDQWPAIDADVLTYARADIGGALGLAKNDARVEEQKDEGTGHEDGPANAKYNVRSPPCFRIVVIFGIPRVGLDDKRRNAGNRENNAQSPGDVSRFG